MQLVQVLNELATIDRWLDDYVSQTHKDQPLAQDYARLLKIGEEFGEAIRAWIIHTGQNPRKPQQDMMVELLAELADVACTALLCMQHFTKDQIVTGAVLVGKVHDIGLRAANGRVRELGY